jgi:phage minor structural protein
MITVYHSKETNFNHNGLSKLHECISCFIKEELNGLYELELEHPSNTKKAAHLKKWNILKVEGQLFRIYNREIKDDGKQILKVWARHISYDLAFFFLEENILPAGSTVWQVLNVLKAGTPFSMNTNIAYSFEFPVVFREIDNLSGLFQMIELYGGELKRDNFNIELNYQIGEDNGVLIKYGKNLQGITETINMDSVITRIYPAGADEIRLPEKYIDSPFINHSEYPPYPIVKKVSFDVYDEWTLRAIAQDYITKVDKPKFTYEVDFVELEKSREYKNYAHLQKLKLGDLVIVRHERLSLDVKLKVLSYEKDVLRGVSSKITLGSPKDNFMDFQLSLLKAKNTVDYAFKKGKLNSATLKGLKIVNENTNITTFEITEEGDTYINGTVVIGPKSVFEEGYDPSEKANRDDLGALAYEDAVEKAMLGTTIIEGGYLKTGFVDASRIDTGTLNANQVNIEARDAENNTVIKIGKIEPEEENKPARYGIRITGDNGELMLDEYGIDPRFIKAFKNLIWNSSFERFDPVTKIPHFWSGGESTANSSFDSTYSMKLEVGQMSEQTQSIGGYNPRPDPAWWDNKRTRVSFFKKGGDVQVQVFSEWDWSPYELTREDGTKATWYNTGHSNNWDDGRYTFSFEPTKPGRIWMRFTNIGDSTAYIDAVQMEPDFNGKYPSFYTHGPFSMSAEEVPLSDTWLEYINVPYAQNISVQFNQRYGLPPTVTASLLRNKNAANSGSAFGNYNISPNIDLIIEDVGGYLFYTGAHITFGGYPPSTIENAYVSVQVVGRL